MLNLNTVHKPTNLADALVLLEEPGAVVLAGGTELIASRRRDVRAVVDVSHLNLADLVETESGLELGAAATLAALAESAPLRAVAGGVAALAAHRTHASLLRNQATLAGTLIAEPGGVLAVVLLALNARVTLARRDAHGVAYDDLELGQFLEGLPGNIQRALVTKVTLSAPMLSRRAALETVGRTPRDRPIVSVCAAMTRQGETVSSADIALGGVSKTAVRAAQAANALIGASLTDETIERAARAAAAGLEPPSDYRGSAAYRREMAQVLTARALHHLR